MAEYYKIAFRTLQVPVPITIVLDEEVTARGQLAIVSRHTETKDYFNVG